MTNSSEIRETLFSELDVGPMRLRNRVVMAPHSTHYADRVESDRLTAYYAERARGGVGLIIHEPVIVHPSSLSRVGKIWGYDRRNASAFRKTTSAVHEHGARIVCQLIHNGRQVDGHESKMPAWYPSETPRSGTIEVTHAMTRDDIADVVAGFAQAARICAEGGFDGVEIHAAHGYLLQGFLSPATNQRDDEYGGSLSGRVRIVQEVLKAVRAAVDNAAFVIGIRLSGDEHQPNGMDPSDCLEVARALRDEIDYVSVVSGSLASFDRIVPDMSFDRGLNVSHAAAIRSEIAPVPVLVTGRIVDPAQASQIIASGQADLVGMARSLIADPNWAHKAAAGEAATIRPCVYANDCRDSIGGRRALVCMVNPSAGREAWRPEVPHLEPRRIAVVGGGAAGMEAAVTAAAQGDAVVLYERSAHLGGQLRLAGSAPGRNEFQRLERFLIAQLDRLGVDVRLGEEPGEDALHEFAPDLFVVATGAVPIGGDLDGTTAFEVLQGAEIASEEVVLEDRSGGNSWLLFSTAEVLASRGHRVTVVSGAHTLGSGIEAASIPPLLRRLQATSVRIDLMSSVVAQDDTGVHVRRKDTGESRVVVNGLVVSEMGRRSAGVDGPWKALGVDVKIVGDALAPRRIATAIAEGRRAVQAAGARTR